MAKKVKVNREYVAGVIEEAGYPEKGYFEEQKDLQKFYKHCTLEELAEWLDLEGLTYNPCDSEPINRMRMCMAILYHHFPKEETTKKSKSKYSQYTLEDLLQMAVDNEVAVELTDNESILRMRVIMALRANKVIE